VTSVSGDNVVIASHQGFSQDIVLGTTQYFEGKNPGSISDVVVGARIIALGTVDVNGTSLDALVVVVWTPVVHPWPTPQIPASQLKGNGFGHQGGRHGGHRGSFARVR
jgi:hypothetical protein